MPPRRDLTVSERLEILEKFDELPQCSQRAAAQLLQIPQSSLSRILQNREAIVAEASNTNVNRKRKRTGKGDVIEHILLDWYFKTIQNNSPVNRSVLAQRAEELAKEYGLENFVANDGWLSRWMARNNISLKKKDIQSIAAGKHNLVTESAKNWIAENVAFIFSNYSPNQVYNTDEAVIRFFDVSKQSNKLSEKDLIPLTVLLTCNMVGVKEHPLIVGKNTYFDLKEIKELPLQFECSEDGFMTREIFASFLLKWDVALSSKSIVLLLDSSYVHFESLSLKNIKLVFIPSDLVYLVQPLSRGIVHNFKSLYKKYIKMKTDSDKTNNDKSLADKTITNAIFVSILEAWVNVGPNYITDCFKKAGFLHESDFKSSIAYEVSKINMKPLNDVSLSWIDEFSGKIDESTACQRTCSSSSHSNESVISDEVSFDGISESGTLKATKYLENEQSAPVEIKDTYNAFLVIRKTLDQNSASPVCYELLQKLEIEVNELLQKSS